MSLNSLKLSFSFPVWSNLLNATSTWSLLRFLQTSLNSCLVTYPSPSTVGFQRPPPPFPFPYSPSLEAVISHIATVKQ